MNMAVSTVTPIITASKNNYNSVNYRGVYNIKSLEMNDSICFKGAKSSKTSLAPNIQNGIEFGEKLIEMLENNGITDDALKNFVIKYVPNATVDKISNLDERVPNRENYIAYILPNYNDKLKLEKLTLYLPEFDTADKKQIAGFIGSSAHEFTHALQYGQDTTYLGLKTYTDDLNTARAFNALASTIFSHIERNYKNAVISSIANKEDISDLKQFKRIFPRPASVSEATVLKAFNISSHSELKNLLMTNFNLAYDKVLKEFNENYPGMLQEMPFYNNKPEKFKAIIRNYCVQKAAREKEAYTTESEIMKKYAGCETSCTTDVMPIAYRLLERSLS